MRSLRRSPANLVLVAILVGFALFATPVWNVSAAETAPPSTLRLGKLDVNLDTLRDAVTADLRQKMEAAVEQGRKQIETSFRSAAQQQAQEIYRDFLSWLAERVHSEVYPDLPIDSPEFQRKFSEWAARPETQIDQYVTVYLEARAPVIGQLLKAYRDEASWEIAGGLEDLWSDAHDKLDRFKNVVDDARKEPNLETSELLRRHGLSGEWMDQFESYEGRFRVFQETMDSYKVVDVTRTVVGAFQTNEPRGKIDALFALLGEVGGVAEESRIPIVSFFGQIAKAYGQLATEMLARLDDLSRVLRARQGYCVGTGATGGTSATSATKDARQLAFVAHLGSPEKGMWGYLACPTRIPDVYERVVPSDARIFFWDGDDFLPGRATGGGVPAVIRSIGFVRDAVALRVPGYAGKEHDWKTIASVYNVDYASKTFGHGIEGLLAEAAATIGGIARREDEVRSAFGPGRCSRSAGEAFLASETGLRFGSGVPAIADNVDRLALQYAAGYLRGRTGAYATYSRIWKSLRDLSILEVRGGVRGLGSCPECAGATLEKTFSAGAREVPGCEAQTTDERGHFVMLVATRSLDFSIGLVAEAGGHRAQRVIVDRRVADLHAVPFVATVSPIWLDFEGGTEASATAEATTETSGGATGPSASNATETGGGSATTRTEGRASETPVPPSSIGRPPSSLPLPPPVPPGQPPEHPPERPPERPSAGLANVVGQPAAQAAATVKQAGFVVSMVAGPAPSSRAEQFTIASQDPVAGTALPPGSTVVLHVRGSFIAMATVPSLAGKTRAEAEALLAAAGLHAVWSEAGAPPGKAQSERVASQSPAAGLGVDATSPVTVKVYGAWVAPPPPPPVAQPTFKFTPEGCPSQVVFDRGNQAVVVALREVNPNGTALWGYSNDVFCFYCWPAPCSMRHGEFASQFELSAGIDIYYNPPGIGKPFRCGESKPTLLFGLRNPQGSWTYNWTSGHNAIFVEGFSWGAELKNAYALIGQVVSAAEHSGRAQRCMEGN